MPEVEAFISVEKQTELAHATTRLSFEQRVRLALVLCAMHSKPNSKDTSSNNTKDFSFAAV
jgi:hypothetical protein